MVEWFISPLVLGGTALVAAPLVLHMVMRRRPVPHAFPALRFLRERAVATRRRLRLRHLILLLVRMAAIVLLSLALARPVLRGAGWMPGAEGPVAAALVFDTAPRMTLREGNRTRLEQAVALARALLDKLPGESRIAVFDTGGSPAAFDPGRAATEVRLDRLESATPAISLAAAIASARRLLETSELERRELYVFTDCSHGGWDDAPAASAKPDAGTGNDEAAKSASEPTVLYVDVGAESPRNLAIDSLELSGDRVAAGTPLVVTATVSGTGFDAARTAAVEIIDEAGQPVRRGMQPIPPGDEGPRTVSFEIGGLKPGTRQGRIVLDGGDALAADDQGAFTVEVGTAARVIVAAARPAERTARFLVEAIAPAPLRLAGTARFAAEPVDFGSLDAAAWDGAAGIVLLDPPPLADRQWEALAAWVAQGRGLVVWLGPAAGDPTAFNSAAAKGVLGGELARVWRSPDAGNFLAPAALDHPILAAFRRVGDAVPWQDFPVFRNWEFIPSPPDDKVTGGPAAVVASYRNGQPAVLDRRLGQGKVVVVTTPVMATAAGDPAGWNMLATGFEPWPFVILANEMLLYAIDIRDDRNVIAGRPATLRLGRRDLPTALVRSPGGDDFPVAIDRVRGTVTITATQQPGNYAVRAGGEVGGVADGFSANLDPAATDFRRLSPEDLGRVLGPAHRLARTEEDIVRAVSRERSGVELFGWAILLAAVAMAADWIMANRFYRPRETEPEAAATAGFEELFGAAAGSGSDAEAGVVPQAGRSVGPPPLPPMVGSGA